MKIFLILLLLFPCCYDNPSTPGYEGDVTTDGGEDDSGDDGGASDDSGDVGGDDGESQDDTGGEDPSGYMWDCNNDGVLDNLNDYQNSGSITSAVFNGTDNMGSPGDVLVAFVGEEQRGVAISLEIPFGPYEGTYQFLMLIYSNESDGETITFKFYDSETDAIYNISETDEFISDMTEGNVEVPILFNTSTVSSENYELCD